jgi:hypothetical protein
MIIHCDIVKNPRKKYRCDQCGKAISGEHIRAFGAAEKGDPPYAIRLHTECSCEKIMERAKVRKRGERDE